MANCVELKALTKARLKTVRILIDAKDWDMAAYIMGYALETALKAATCKALHIDQYPDDCRSYRNEKIGNYFKTHNFDMLLLVSGATDLFSVDSPVTKAFQNWSDFTQEYQGDWVGNRYISGKFDSAKVNGLYLNLQEDADSILKIMSRYKKW